MTITRINSNDIKTVVDYAALRAIRTAGLTDGTSVPISQRATKGDGGGGTFTWDSADRSADVTSDSLSGIYVAPTTDLTGASGAWVRAYDSNNVSPLWFISAMTSEAVQAASDYLTLKGGGIVRLKSGTWDFNNFRAKNRVKIIGDGANSTFIQQRLTGSPAYYALADVSYGALVGISLEGVKLLGAVGATVAIVKVEALTPYVVHNSLFDYAASNTYQALEMICNSEIYSCAFKVVSDYTSVVSVITKGSYNKYELFLTNCGSGLGISDVSTGSLFLRPITDGQQEYSGQNNTVVMPSVEFITAAVSTAVTAFLISGYNNTIITPTATNIDVSKVSSQAAFNLYHDNTILGLRIYGNTYSVPYPMTIDSGAACTIGGGGYVSLSSSYKLNQYVPAATLRNQTFIGDCTYLLGGSVVPPKTIPSSVPIGSVAYASFGSDISPSAPGQWYFAKVNVDHIISISKVGILQGSVVGSNIMVAIYNETGALTSNSSSPGVITSGANSFQEISLYGPITLIPGVYFVGFQLNNTTGKVRVVSDNTFIGVDASSETGVYGDPPSSITPPSAPIADTAPICYLV